jgi:teichuronic acid biosynthesis glycosyltransferase TuaH
MPAQPTNHRTRKPPPTRTEAADELLVICAGNNYDAVKLHDQHMAERLAARAHVLYVDPPLSRLTPRNDPRLGLALEGPRLRRVDAGFWRLTPVVTPFPMRQGARTVTERLVRHALRRAVRTIGMDVRALVSAWPSLDVFGSCGERLRVWWAQDDFAAGAGLMGQSARRVAAGERARAAGSDLVIAANPDLAARMRDDGHDVELVPYGSDPETFAHVEHVHPAAGIGLGSPVAILVGQLNERVDPALLQAVADRGVSLLLVGPTTPSGAPWLDVLARRPNVSWVGAQPFADLPSFMAHAQVGLVPYADTAFNRASFPLKTLEYLSAGLPVVATGLPATRWLGASPDLITIADDPTAFAAGVMAAIEPPLTGAARERRRAFARAHSYDQRAIEVLAAIDRRLAGTVPTSTTREYSALRSALSN